MSLGDAAVNSSHSMSKEHWLKFVFSPGWLSKHFTDCVKPDLRAGTVRKVMSSTLKWRRGTFFVFHQPQGYSKSISLYLPGWEPRGLVPEVCVPNPLNEIDKTVHIRHCNEGVSRIWNSSSAEQKVQDTRSINASKTVIRKYEGKGV
ncbi:uncharacterized protein [Gorilla gorilla gorilla]|uniref:uncharacterized protein isoform X4 n=1 Tax=Gorilla gorilla gorilla TaxID=9595 RepID=UPI0030081435